MPVCCQYMGLYGTRMVTENGCNLCFIGAILEQII